METEMLIMNTQNDWLISWCGALDAIKSVAAFSNVFHTIVFIAELLTENFKLLPMHHNIIRS